MEVCDVFLRVDYRRRTLLVTVWLVGDKPGFRAIGSENDRNLGSLLYVENISNHETDVSDGVMREGASRVGRSFPPVSGWLRVELHDLDRSRLEIRR